MAVKLGKGKWAVKEDKLLAYNDNSGRFFNKEFDFSRGSNATYVAKDGLIKTTASDVPRIDFSDSTSGALLLENSSSNLITYSEDISQSYWNKRNINVTANDTISPDGTQNASKITTFSTVPYLGNDNISLTTGNVYTISCFVKKGTNRWIRLSSVSSSSLGAWFDLDNNVVGTVNSISASIENYGNGWYRISNTITAISGSNQTFLGFSSSDGGTEVVGTGHTVFAWGLQVEESSFATSYIPTSGSATSRSADVCNNSGSAQDFNSVEGVLYAEVAALAEQTLTRYITLSNGTSSNRIIIYITGVGVIKFFVGVGGVTQAAKTVSGQTTTNFNKLAVSYKENDMKFYLNGVKVHTDTSALTFPVNTLNVINFAASNGTSSPFFGKIKETQVFTTALTDEQLAALTTI